MDAPSLWTLTLYDRDGSLAFRLEDRERVVLEAQTTDQDRFRRLLLPYLVWRELIGDLSVRNGTDVDRALSHERLYEVFGRSWPRYVDEPLTRPGSDRRGSDPGARAP